MGAFSAPFFSLLPFLLYTLIPTSSGYFERAFSSCQPAQGAPKTFHDFKAKALNGSEIDFKIFKNKVVMVINVATF